MIAKKCPSCGKERCPGIVTCLDCPSIQVFLVRRRDETDWRLCHLAWESDSRQTKER